MSEKAPKLDAGKAPLHLIHPVFKQRMAEVLEFGAKKYAPWSWMKGKEWSRDLAAIHRHLDAWQRGEIDPETGKSHLAHVACDLMFLLVSEELGLGEDDRPKLPSPPKADDNGLHVEAYEAGGCIVCGAPEREGLFFAHSKCWDEMPPTQRHAAMCFPGFAGKGTYGART